MTHEVAASHRLPPHPQAPPDAEEEPFWGYQCGFVDERTVVASTRERYGYPRHWLIDTARGDVLGWVEYSTPVSEDPMALGDGTWLTCGEDPFQLLLWSLPPRVEDDVSSTAAGR